MSEIIPIKERVTGNMLALEECLLKLCEYGNPRLSCTGNGQWYCALDMFVQGKGVEFKVASDFREVSMQHAVNACYERLMKALADLGL